MNPYIISESTDNFVVGRFSIPITQEILNEILANIDLDELSATEIGSIDDAEAIDEVRQGSIAWLDDCTLTNEVLKHFTAEINQQYWPSVQLADDYPPIQFTLYSDVGDHYDWHQDYYKGDEDENDGFIRKLSISLCLSHSDEYEGAEFFIKDGSDTNVRVFHMMFGDFIVFPSDVEHRVNELRSGERVSLVTWYGDTKKSL